MWAFKRAVTALEEDVTPEEAWLMVVGESGNINIINIYQATRNGVLTAT